MEPEVTAAVPVPLEVVRYLDVAGQKQSALAYLAGYFRAGRMYSEHEVNEILLPALACSDYVSVRRELCDCGYLARERDGSHYWRVA